MNQKKCPKCGENNPAEAVMCWACYTPLSGGATVAAGAGGATMAAPGAAVAGNQEGEKKAVAPWQIGLIVGALLLGLGFGAYSMMGSSDAPIDIVGNTNTTGPGPSDYGTGPSGGVVAPPAPVDPGFGGGPTGGAPVAPVQAPYQMVSSPNVDTTWGVVAIVPNKPTGVNAAASLAKFAHGQFKNVKSWQGMQIFVFQDTESGQLFNQFQTMRGQARLGPGDYAQLNNLWPKCLAVYEYRNGGGERVLRPSTNPTGWYRAR